MSARSQKLLDADEFLAWADGREGKWELYDGVPAAMSPERARHIRVKGCVYIALSNAIARAGLPCEALTDGMTVRVKADQAFIPDALVVCPEIPPDAMIISNPVIVVEVLSPATAATDHGIKLEGYFSLSSLAHYLILDPDRRVVIHHARGPDGSITTRIRREGRLKLDPPGLEFAVAELLGMPDRAP
jgi:Uma2 family endonuclease